SGTPSTSRRSVARPDPTRRSSCSIGPGPRCTSSPSRPSTNWSSDMSAPFVFSRRRFLQQAGGLSALTLAASMDKLGLSSAAAQAAGYRALVCVFMFGGNDSNNMVIPSTNYAQYLAARPVSSGINIPQASLLPITPANAGGAVYGLHPAMPELQNL